jgi:uncharacterized protein YutE (UPF0331/DUF86 family)
MSAADKEVLAERIAEVGRHLDRVAARLPEQAEDLTPGSDASDAVILHLWQAVQIVIDLAISMCVRLNLGTPSSYADAFVRMQKAGHIESALADRLQRACGFRNLVAHAYEQIDLLRVHRIAQAGPADLRQFLAIVRDLP